MGVKSEALRQTYEHSQKLPNEGKRKEQASGCPNAGAGWGADLVQNAFLRSKGNSAS